MTATRDAAAIAIAAIVNRLPAGERNGLVADLVQGMLVPHRDALAPLIATLLELQGVIVVTLDARGLHLDSTSLDDASAHVLAAVLQIHTAIRRIIDDLEGRPPKAWS